MVARASIHRPSLNGGEYADTVEPRHDLPEYASGCRRMRNAEPILQSGFKAMPGSMEIGKVRKQMSEIFGTTNSLTGPFAVAPAIVEEITFSPTKINSVFIDNINADVGVTGLFYCEARIGGIWQAFGPVFTLGENANNRIASLGPDKSILADGVRLQINASASTDIVVLPLRVFAEGDLLANGSKLFNYSFSSGETFCLSVTPNWCDVYRDGAYKGSFMLNVTEQMIPVLNSYSEGNTVGFFHQDLESQRAFRIGGVDHEWSVDLWPYKKIGDTNYGTFINGEPYVKTADVWEINFRWQGDPTEGVFNLIVDQEETGGVSKILDIDNVGWTAWTALAVDMQAALEGLPSFGAGVVVEFISAANGDNYRVIRVTFDGDFSGSQYEFACQAVNTSEISTLVTHKTIGDTQGEPLISVDRGWPRLAEIAQDRLCYAGLKAKPAGMIFSQNGEYFNLNTDQLRDNSPFAAAVRVDFAEEIAHILYSKYFVIFTTGAEYFDNTRELNRNKPRNLIKASTNGCSLSVKPLDVEGVIYYANQDGNVMYFATYDDVQTSYESMPASTFAPHLFKNVIQSALRKPDDDTPAFRMLFCRSDGRLIQVMVMRTQNINAYCEWQTDGEILSVTVDAKGLVYLQVKREYADGFAINMEVWDAEQWLHGAVDYGATAIDGKLIVSPALEGKTMWVVADGYSLGEFTVIDGQIDLETFYGKCFVGWWTAPLVEPLPFVKVLRSGDIIRRPGRVHTSRSILKNTTSLAIGANGELPRDISLYRAGDAVDKPPAPYNGIREVTGLGGMIENTTIVYTQLKPGSLEVRDIVVEAYL